MAVTLSLATDGGTACAAAAAAVIRVGGLVVAPTDTVYGLLGAFGDGRALERIYAAKGRDADKRLIALVGTRAQAAALSALPLPPFLETAWPGPLTVIVPAAPGHPHGWDTQAVRLPDDGFLAALLAALDAPVFAPSANPQGASPAADCAQARGYFGDEVDLYVDGGAATGSAASTIVALTAEGIRLVRGGAASLPPGTVSSRTV